MAKRSSKWYTDDGSEFNHKKDAEAYEKFLEAKENFVSIKRFVSIPDNSNPPTSGVSVEVNEFIEYLHDHGETVRVILDYVEGRISK